MNRSQAGILIVVIIVVIAIGFPTPRSVTREDLVTTFDCSMALLDGQQITFPLTDLKDQTKIVVDITSTEDVTVTMKGLDTFYAQTKKTHQTNFTRTETTLSLTILNPRSLSTGPDAFMTGSVKAYHLYRVQIWLPWWMP